MLRSLAVSVVALLLAGCAGPGTTGSPTIAPSASPPVTASATSATPATPTVSPRPSTVATTTLSPTAEPPTATPAASTAPATSIAATTSPASSSPSSGQAPSITVTAEDYFYTAPERAPAGLVTLELANKGTEPHEAQLVHLHAGKQLRDLAEAAQDPTRAALLGIVDFAGGSNTIEPGTSSTTVQSLDTGIYGILCFVRAADGVPHVVKGMLGGFTVAGPAGSSSLPSTDRAVEIKEFQFSVPDHLPAGSQSFSVKNTGTQPHESGLVRIDDGKTIDDVFAYFQDRPQGTSPWTFAGGLAAQSPGETASVTLDLEPGAYAFMCLVPDKDTGRPHAALGMIMGVTVP